RGRIADRAVAAEDARAVRPRVGAIRIVVQRGRLIFHEWMEHDRKRRLLSGPQQLSQIRALVAHDQQTGDDAAVELAAAAIALGRLDPDRSQIDVGAVRRRRRTEAHHESDRAQRRQSQDDAPPRGASSVSRTFVASILGRTGLDRNASPSSSTPWWAMAS